MRIGATAIAVFAGLALGSQTCLAQTPTAAPAARAPKATTAPNDAELLFWQSIMNSKSQDDYEAYLQTYPTGRFVALAKARLKSLSSTPTTAQSSQSPAGTQISTASEAQRGFLGTELQDLTQDRAKTLGLDQGIGVVISNIVNGSPAEAAGLKVGDVITALDGQPVWNSADAVDRIRSSSVGSTENLSILRNGTHLEIKVIVGKMTEQQSDLLAGQEAYSRKDYAQAMAWFRKAADQGQRDAQAVIGSMYYFGQGVPQDYPQAMAWYRKAADQGQIDAVAAIGNLYYFGQGVPQDYAQAMTWYRKAADQGQLDAVAAIGNLYYFGQVVPQDYAEAMAWYRKAADQGQRDGQAAVGNLYYLGQGVTKDYAQAMAWYRKAADQGQRDAQDAVGNLYFLGQGVPQDYAQALAWYRKAADQGYALAQFQLGFLYDGGKGVAQDHAQALSWYGKAASQGQADAQKALLAAKAAPGQVVNVICKAPNLSTDATFSYRLDYARNTITSPAGIARTIQMTDQEITWDDTGPDGTVKNTLQRYSGQLTQVKAAQTFTFSCQPG